MTSFPSQNKKSPLPQSNAAEVIFIFFEGMILMEHLPSRRTLLCHGTIAFLPFIEAPIEFHHLETHFRQLFSSDFTTSAASAIYGNRALAVQFLFANGFKVGITRIDVLTFCDMAGSIFFRCTHINELYFGSTDLLFEGSSIHTFESGLSILAGCHTEEADHS